jgi:hypothetical protein
LLADGIPETDYLAFPYVVRAARHWVFGPTESSKTLYLQWLAARLTREGRTITFISAENPLATDLDRMSRLRPDWQRLRYYHMPALDLNDPAHFAELARVSVGSDLVVIDTLSACWSGDENSNAEVVKLDREVLSPLVQLTRAAIALIHHTGHPQAFVNRGGASAGRGASAMGQKADVVLVFAGVGLHEFTIAHEKNRTPGGYKEPKARFMVVDTDDHGLDIEPMGKHVDERVRECMDTAVQMIAERGDGIGTNLLTETLKSAGFGGGTIDNTFKELRTEQPPRTMQIDGMVVGADGRHRKGRPWVLSTNQPSEPPTDPGGH